MMSYLDSNRGTYQNEDHAKQIVSFEGMTFMGSTGKYNVTPTDVDGLIQLDNENAFIFFEIKHGAAIAPSGQAKALTRTVDTLTRGGGNAILFISTHNKDDGENVIAANTIVDRFYENGEWVHRGKHVVTLKQCIDNYLAILNEKEKSA